jgi:hypothetical protein
MWNLVLACSFLALEIDHEIHNVYEPAEYMAIAHPDGLCWLTRATTWFDEHNWAGRTLVATACCNADSKHCCRERANQSRRKPDRPTASHCDQANGDNQP